jgi:ATP-binding cassette subfamily F protein 3
VRSAYFAQDTADDLPAGKTAVECVQDGTRTTNEEARALLGRLGLGGDSGDKEVEAFSGGERRRIMLARLMARAADLLFLDEPTNDLDIASREALEGVLTAYGGAIVAVSHDRYLLQRLAEKVLWLHDGTATVIEGGYEAFEAAQRPAPAAAPPPKPAASKPASGSNAERDQKKQRERAARDLVNAEREVARLDAERARIEIDFADPAVYGEPVRVAGLKRELIEVEKALETAYARWEELLGK